MSRESTISTRKESVSCFQAIQPFVIVAFLALGIVFAAPQAAGQTHSSAHGKNAIDPASLAAPVKTYGSKSAPITIEVFTDFQCPACANFYRTTLRSLINDYVAAGKVYLVHRDFPLPMHQYSYQAARWANAAGKIGRFGEVEGALYDNQAAWSVDGNIQKVVTAAVSPHELAQLQKLMTGCEGPPSASVKPAGMTAAQGSSSACSVDAYINQDLALGKQIPVSQTPTFVVYSKGQKISTVPGQISWDILKKFIDSLMAQ